MKFGYKVVVLLIFLCSFDVIHSETTLEPKMIQVPSKEAIDEGGSVTLRCQLDFGRALITSIEWTFNGAVIHSTKSLDEPSPPVEFSEPSFGNARFIYDSQIAVQIQKVGLAAQGLFECTGHGLSSLGDELGPSRATRVRHSLKVNPKKRPEFTVKKLDGITSLNCAYEMPSESIFSRDFYLDSHLFHSHFVSHDPINNKTFTWTETYDTAGYGIDNITAFNLPQDKLIKSHVDLTETNPKLHPHQYHCEIRNHYNGYFRLSSIDPNAPKLPPPPVPHQHHHASHHDDDAHDGHNMGGISSQQPATTCNCHCDFSDHLRPQGIKGIGMIPGPPGLPGMKGSKGDVGLPGLNGIPGPCGCKSP